MRDQDDHVAGVVCGEQVRVSQGWSERSGLSLGATDVGYGHSTDQVAAVRLDASFLGGYAEAVHARTARAVAALSDGHLDRVLDASCALPVTAGVRRSVCSVRVYSTWGRADTCAVCYDAVTEVGAFSP